MVDDDFVDLVDEFVVEVFVEVLFVDDVGGFGDEEDVRF